MIVELLKFHYGIIHLFLWRKTLFINNKQINMIKSVSTAITGAHENNPQALGVPARAKEKLGSKQYCSKIQ